MRQRTPARRVPRRRRTAARQALTEFYDTAKAANIPECDRLARTIRRWEPEILAYYRTDGTDGTDGLSNGRTEAVNALCKKVKRIGHGFRNLENYRLRLLLHCGGITWQDQPAATHQKPLTTLRCVEP